MSSYYLSNPYNEIISRMLSQQFKEHNAVFMAILTRNLPQRTSGLLCGHLPPIMALTHTSRTTQLNLNDLSVQLSNDVNQQASQRAEKYAAMIARLDNLLGLNVQVTVLRELKEDMVRIFADHDAQNSQNVASLEARVQETSIWPPEACQPRSLEEEHKQARQSMKELIESAKATREALEEIEESLYRRRDPVRYTNQSQTPFGEDSFRPHLGQRIPSNPSHEEANFLCSVSQASLGGGS